jgi:hypothetical protein
MGGRLLVNITDLILDTFSVSRLVSTSCLFIVNKRVNTACEREELVKGE